MLVWVTGTSGSGKSTACSTLKEHGFPSVDADWEGFNCWTDRESGEVVAEPPDPVPRGWLDQYGWTIIRSKVENLVVASRERTVFLCGYVENDADVRDLFDHVICLVIDDRTLVKRLTTRTTNSFGKHPEELWAALALNARAESEYRRLGATTIDGSLPPAEVARQIVGAVGS